VYPSIHLSLLISSGQMVGHQWRKQDISCPKIVSRIHLIPHFE
jgi:hypothetical protein